VRRPTDTLWLVILLGLIVLLTRWIRAEAERDGAAVPDA
jgi:hypothetical protein